MEPHKMHREDIKALIRKKHGTVLDFANANGLGPTSVSDFFRGRTSKRTRAAVERLIAESKGKAESITVDNINSYVSVHPLNAKAA